MHIEHKARDAHLLKRSLCCKVHFGSDVLMHENVNVTLLRRVEEKRGCFVYDPEIYGMFGLICAQQSPSHGGRVTHRSESTTY